MAARVELPIEPATGRFLFVRYLEEQGGCDECGELALFGVFDGQDSELLCREHAGLYLEAILADVREDALA